MLTWFHVCILEIKIIHRIATLDIKQVSIAHTHIHPSITVLPTLMGSEHYFNYLSVCFQLTMTLSLPSSASPFIHSDAKTMRRKQTESGRTRDWHPLLFLLWVLVTIRSLHRTNLNNLEGLMRPATISPQCYATGRTLLLPPASNMHLLQHVMLTEARFNTLCAELISEVTEKYDWDTWNTGVMCMSPGIENRWQSKNLIDSLCTEIILFRPNEFIKEFW